MELTNNDLIRAYLKQMLPATVSDGTSQPIPGEGVLSSYSTDTNATNGAVTAPVVGNDIATIASLTGLYEVNISAMYTAGAPAAAEANNLIFVATTTRGQIIIPPVLNVPSVPFRYIVRLNNLSIRVRCFAASTAGVIYSVLMTADKLSP